MKIPDIEEFTRICLRSRETAAYENVNAIDAIRNIKCCLVGAKGLGLEIAKNLALSGFETIDIMDTRCQRSGHTFFAKKYAMDSKQTNAMKIQSYINDHIGKQIVREQKKIEVQNYDLIIMVNHGEPYLNHQLIAKQCIKHGITYMAIDYKGIGFVMDCWKKNHDLQKLEKYNQLKKEVLVKLIDKLNAFYHKNDSLPRTYSKEAIKIAENIEEKYYKMAKSFCMCADGEFIGMTNLIGGVVSQQALQLVLTKKTQPIRYIPYFVDLTIVPPEVIQKECLNMKDYPSRNAFERFVGNTLYMEKARGLMFLQVGAGALGCELLKNHAMMGIRKGLLYDFDKIELSNTSRQFLFQTKDVGSNKAEKAVSNLNSLIKSKYQYDVIKEHFEFKTIESKKVGEKQVLISAVDNALARYLLKRAALYHELPMLDGGTKGFSGRVDVLIPNETYEQLPYRHPTFKEKIETFSCTLKQIPSSYSDCVFLVIELFMNEWLFVFPNAQKNDEIIQGNFNQSIRYEEYTLLKETSNKALASQDFLEIALIHFFERDASSTFSIDKMPNHEILQKELQYVFLASLDSPPSTFDNNNYHQVLVVYILSFWLAKRHNIADKECDFRDYCKILYSKSIPALISTTSMVTGLMSSNVLKVIYKQLSSPVEWFHYSIPEILYPYDYEDFIIDQTWKKISISGSFSNLTFDDIKSWFPKSMKNYDGQFYLDFAAKGTIESLLVASIQKNTLTFYHALPIDKKKVLLRFESTQKPSLFFLIITTK